MLENMFELSVLTSQNEQNNPLHCTILRNSFATVCNTGLGAAVNTLNNLPPEFA